MRCKLRCRLSNRATFLDRGTATYGERCQRERIEGSLQRAHGIGPQPEVLRDALTLLSKPQNTADGLGRRGAQ